MCRTCRFTKRSTVRPRLYRYFSCGRTYRGRQLFEAGKTGRGINTQLLVKAINFGTEAVERMLFALHQRNYIENTSNDTWVLARRLNDVTLYDLMRSLEIGSNPDDLSIASNEWRQKFLPPL